MEELPGLYWAKVSWLELGGLVGNPVVLMSKCQEFEHY